MSLSHPGPGCVAHAYEHLRSAALVRTCTPPPPSIHLQACLTVPLLWPRLSSGTWCSCCKSMATFPTAPEHTTSTEGTLPSPHTPKPLILPDACALHVCPAGGKATCSQGARIGPPVHGCPREQPCRLTHQRCSDSHKALLSAVVARAPPANSALFRHTRACNGQVSVAGSLTCKQRARHARQACRASGCGHPLTLPQPVLCMNSLPTGTFLHCSSALPSACCMAQAAPDLPARTASSDLVPAGIWRRPAAAARRCILRPALPPVCCASLALRRPKGQRRAEVLPAASRRC